MESLHLCLDTAEMKFVIDACRIIYILVYVIQASSLLN